MEHSYRNGLRSQIREAYGKLVYTYTTHLKQAEQIRNRNQSIEFWRIVLSAAVASGVLISAVTGQVLLLWVAAVASVGLFGLSLYGLGFNPDSVMWHQMTSEKLWIIRERYISLLTDFESLSDQEIVSIRDRLQKQTARVYRSAPLTNTKSYMAAQKALKEDEEQFLRASEIDRMLPEHLRKVAK